MILAKEGTEARSGEERTIPCSRGTCSRGTCTEALIWSKQGWTLAVQAHLIAGDTFSLTVHTEARVVQRIRHSCTVHNPSRSASRSGRGIIPSIGKALPVTRICSNVHAEPSGWRACLRYGSALHHCTSAHHLALVPYLHSLDAHSKHHRVCLPLFCLPIMRLCTHPAQPGIKGGMLAGVDNCSWYSPQATGATTH